MISVRGRLYTDNGEVGAIEQGKLEVRKWYLKPAEGPSMEMVETLQENDEDMFNDWLKGNGPGKIEWEVEAETVLLSGNRDALISKQVHLRLVSSKKVYTGDAYVTAITKIGETNGREILSISLRGTGVLHDAADRPGK